MNMKGVTEKLTVRAGFINTELKSYLPIFMVKKITYKCICVRCFISVSGENLITTLDLIYYNNSKQIRKIKMD